MVGKNRDEEDEDDWDEDEDDWDEGEDDYNDDQDGDWEEYD